MKFNLLEHDLSSTIAVVVMEAIDGSSHHAIAVHDGLIFDSNEPFAIPLTKPNLDLMCSTDKRQSLFVRVSSGYLFMDSRLPLKDEIRELKSRKSTKK